MKLEHLRWNGNLVSRFRIVPIRMDVFVRLTTVVTGPPPKTLISKTRVIGGSHARTPSMGVLLWGESLLCFVPVFFMGVMIPNG